MPQPNILFIICHDLGQHLGCYGAGIETPNLDRLASQGVRFTNYHCTAASCSPSRGSIFTGRYPHNNGLVGLAHIGWEYNPGEKTMQMLLSEAGYSTHLFGVQHETGGDPRRLGYQHIEATGGKARELAPKVGEWLRRVGQGAPLSMQGEGRDARPTGRPWFACMGTFEPHRPYETEGYQGDDPATVRLLPWLPDKPGIRADIADLNGMVYALDEAVGEVMGGLEESGLAEETLVVFTTDHGLAMPRAKGTCYDPGTKTALMMRWPGHIREGGVCDELLTNCDLLPTLLQMVGVAAPGNLDGVSFAKNRDVSCFPATTAPPGAPENRIRPYFPREHIFTEMTWHDKYNPMRCVRTRDFKYIRNFGDRPLVYLPLDIWQGRAGVEVRDEYYATRRPEEELYDLRADPLETNNLVGDPRYAEVLADLRKRVDDWMRETDDPLLRGDWPPTPQQVERMNEWNTWN